jgi:hypothetical protein
VVRGYANGLLEVCSRGRSSLLPRLVVVVGGSRTTMERGCYE